jgi:hypothetical protein
VEEWATHGLNLAERVEDIAIMYRAVRIMPTALFEAALNGSHQTDKVSIASGRVISDRMVLRRRASRHSSVLGTLPTSLA